MDTALANHGIRAQWSQEGGTPASGWSLMVQNLDLLENREDDVPLWSVYDNQVYEIERAILDVESGGWLPDDRPVNFSEVKFPLSPQEERDNRDWRLEKGLDSIVDYLMAENPDGYETPKKALEKILENRRINKEAGVRAGDAPEEAASLFERRA